MPEDEMSTGGEGGEGGNTLPDTDPNECVVFVDGQFVPCPTPEDPQPNIPSQTLCPTCNQINPDVPPSGTRSNYFWDSQSIIKKATAPLDTKKGKNKK
jgi:hypothetical protein